MSAPSADWQVLTEATWQQLKAVNFSDHAVDDFIQRRAWHYKQELLIQTWVLAQGSQLIGFISFANATISAQDSDRVVDPMGLSIYPAVNLSFIGVLPEYRGRGIGTAMVGQWLSLFASESNRTGCRMATVFAKPELAKPFYKEKCGFVFVTPQPRKLDPDSTPKMFLSLMPAARANREKYQAERVTAIKE